MDKEVDFDAFVNLCFDFNRNRDFVVSIMKIITGFLEQNKSKDSYYLEKVIDDILKEKFFETNLLSQNFPNKKLSYDQSLMPIFNYIRSNEDDHMIDKINRQRNYSLV